MSCVAGRNVRTVPTSLACDGNHAHRARVTRVHRAQAHHRGVDRAHVAADDRLRGGDDVTRDQHGVDRRVRMRAVAALAVDRDLDAVGGGHGGPGRDADASRRQARPVVQRVHLARAGSGRTGRRRSSPWHRRSPPRPAGRCNRRCRRSASSRAGTSRPRAASSCARRARSRACGLRSATCARTRSPPASAARPCPRAGRPRGRSRCASPESPRPRRSCRCRCDARCRARRAARCTTRAVRCSSKPSSGWAWRSRRMAVNSS